MLGLIPSPLFSETADSAQKRWSMKILVPPVWSHEEFPIKCGSGVLIAALLAAAGLATIQALLCKTPVAFTQRSTIQPLGKVKQPHTDWYRTFPQTSVRRFTVSAIR